MIFVSYRRLDTGPVALALRAELELRLDGAPIFVDVNRIQGGDAWKAVLDNALTKANILIALIGPDWAGPKPDGGFRINDPDDTLREEVARALRHPSRAVLPILVRDAQLPPAEALPEDVRPILDLQALPLRMASWDQDLRAISDVLAGRFGVRLKRTDHTLPKPSAIKSFDEVVSDEKLDAMAAQGLLNGWSVQTIHDVFKTGAVREFLKKTYNFERAVDAFAFLGAISEVVKKRDHHPMIEAVYRDVTLRLSTFDKGHFITMNDIHFASDVDRVAARWPYRS